MGAGIAQLGCQAGLRTLLYDPLPEARERGAASVRKRLGDVPELVVVDELDELAACGLVIEAVPERPELKRELFGKLSERNPEIVLATNTSSIPVMKLAMATDRPASVLGLHFFNPVPVMHLVELIPSLLTAPETSTRAEAFAGNVLGKRVIRSKDRAGFIVNALLIPYLLSAIRMLESGFATAEDIDSGVVEGLRHPMGPLALTDLIGLDTTIAVSQSLYEEFKEPLYAPPPLLSRMVEAGLLGRKVGRGFYDYTR
jgi:3-hydroxybutyryl-CoA dehydrogenase